MEEAARARYLELKREAACELESTYGSSLVDLLRCSGYSVTRGGLTVRMARQFGFCMGVERAVQIAYQTALRYPDKRIFITAEIIHNAFVNQKLAEKGFLFLDGKYAAGHTYADITSGDVVILPAFGAPVKEIEAIRGKGALIVDTTCGAVANVWRNVHKNARDGFTSVIHGKYSHEETIATASRAAGAADGISIQSPVRDGKYIIVRDLEEARLVRDYILNRGDRAAFLARFARALSEGFDPDRDLQRVGLTNQTTMLSSESLAIQELLKAAFHEKFGAREAERRFRSFDTICTATQDRQDAVMEQMRERPDAQIVIGGYNSSNTTHLAAIGREHGVPSYHIDDAACLLSREQIRHQPLGKTGEVVAEGWWPRKARAVISVTAGASTPNNKIGEVFLRLFELAGVDARELLGDAPAPPARGKPTA